MQVASLFLETAYSFNGSNILVEDLFIKAKQAGYQTLVLSDKKMHAAYQFYHLALKHGIHPVIGLQVRLEGIFSNTYILVICYAQNEMGYKNLLKLSSLQSYNQTIPLDLFRKYNEHTSVVIMFHEGELHEARHSSKQLKSIVHELHQVTKHLYFGMHKDLVVVENDFINTLPLDYVAYFEESDDSLYQNLKMILQNNIPNVFKDLKAHLKPLEHFNEFEYNDLKKLDNFLKKHTLRLSEEVPKLPQYINEHGLSSENYLRALSQKGLEKRLKNQDIDSSQYFLRLEEELSTIHELGYDDYFLIVWDVIRYARSEQLLVGPGRGSAPGSLVAYALGITHVDPLKFDLMFERFLNKARSSMPDIDIDFPDYSREKIIQYTVERYGKEYVSYICTFGTFLKKSALRDSARIFEIQKKYLDETMRLSLNYESVSEMIENDLDIINRIDSNPSIKEWLFTAKKIEGLPKHVSTHAAGIILSSQPITEYSAISDGIGGHHQTQYPMEDLETIGLLKMDFLGLRNLTMIEDILENIKIHENKTINLYQLPYDDEKTFQLLREKSPTGLFQLESTGMRQLIKDIQIKEFNDIVTILALFRPGPMQSIKTYLKRRNKQEKVTYLSLELEHILESTEGILLYQEQIMEIAKSFAEYSLIEADLLRRAISKKDEHSLQNERKRFVEKAIKANKNEQLAHQIYDYIVTFANYGFNKSHSVAYAVIAYWMAYLKAHYPAYFIAVLMQNALGNKALLKDYRHEAQTLGITLVAPDVNWSENRFVLKNQMLYYPLNGIRNIGKTSANALVQSRNETSFQSFADFLVKTKHFMNKRNYESLIYSGACDCFQYPRKMLIENLESLIHYIDYQGSEHLERFVYTKCDEFNDMMLRNYQEEVLGLAFSTHKLMDYLKFSKNENPQRLYQIDQLSINQMYTFIASLDRINQVITKDNEKMAFITLEDESLRFEAVLFPTVYKRYEDTLAVGKIALVTGRLTLQKQQRQVIIEKIDYLEIVPKQGEDHS